ncbi:exodeoxyribonuclease VII large subunit [Granulicella sp. L46]|uniref:exodeoxyribonuclease VII large subunit n=1 Tax=Granulicella sp. L46 TaxID=1641865 RepID=UPI00131AF974|nr:exodeoxyribonuclease VII large subunit [Granulicella sp. L46]
MPDDIPSLADLRRTRSRKPATRPEPPSSPSLFDTVPDVTAADILAEQSRSLSTPPPSKLSRSAEDTPALRAEAAQDVFTVGELVRHIRNLVERTHGHVTVEGEISNWRPAASGHCYFTLKDAEAQLSIVLFRRQATLLRFRPKDGDAVRISGSLSIYESRGQLQLVAETMQQTGLGALLAATQALKERLRREGLFDNQRPLPPFPHCIGVVTSLQGAALRDIVKVCRRRHAAVNLLIYPAAVQGPNCPAEIAAGINWFSARPNHADVVLVARGGGSWEDLHGFDAEIVARAIAACSVPVITGIGHATDTTIADAAADLHAPTPSAAAELLTASQHGIADRLARLQSRLTRANRYNLLRLRQRLSALNADAILRRARTTFERRAQHLDDLTDRAETSLNRTLNRQHQRLAQLETRLRRQDATLRLANDRHRFQSLTQRLRATRTIPLQQAHTRLNRATSRLEALSPLRVLERGYALVYAPDGTLLRNATQAPAGTAITAQLAKGRLRAKVTSTD